MFTMQIAIVFLLLTMLLAQECVTDGRQCNEHKVCCGGCCAKGKCISCNERTFYIHDYMTSYEDCIYVNHRCRDRRCPPGTECYMSKPIPECIGCETIPSCQTTRK